MLDSTSWKNLTRATFFNCWDCLNKAALHIHVCFKQASPNIRAPSSQATFNDGLECAPISRLLPRTLICDLCPMTPHTEQKNDISTHSDLLGNKTKQNKKQPETQKKYLPVLRDTEPTTNHRTASWHHQSVV